MRSLSNFSGILRETVRRKLAILLDKGWVVRDGRGFVSATDKTKQELVPLTISCLVYLTRMKATLTV